MPIASEKIVALRNDFGWSQRKLAIISGISERTIQRIEQDGSTCSLETKLALASAFDVPPQALSPMSEKPECVDSTPEFFAKLKVPQASVLLLAGYLLLASGFSFRTALQVFIYSMVSLSLSCALSSGCVYGLRSTRRLLTDLRWNDRYPAHISSMNERVRQARTLIVFLYALGLFLPHLAESIVNFVSARMYGRPMELGIQSLNTVVPAGCFAVAVFMAEFWIRPCKHRLERMLPGRSSPEISG